MTSRSPSTQSCGLLTDEAIRATAIAAYWPVSTEQDQQDQLDCARDTLRPFLAYHRTGGRAALVDRIAKTQAATHGVPEAWTSFIPEADAVVTALVGDSRS